MSWFANWFARHHPTSLDLGRAGVFDRQAQQTQDDSEQFRKPLLLCVVRGGLHMVPHEYELVRLVGTDIQRIWRRLFFLACAAAFHPTEPVVYILKLIYPRGKEGGGLPAVATVRFDLAGGQPAETEQPLSMGSSLNHLAIMADGKHLLVALCEGAYDLIPISQAGNLGEISFTHREDVADGKLGPTFLLAHPTLNLAYGCNLAGCRIDLVRVNGAELIVETDMKLASGTQPFSLALHAPSGRLFVSSVIGERIAAIKVDRKSGQPVGPFLYTFAKDVSGVLVTHPTKNLLYVAHGPRPYNSDYPPLLASMSVWDISSGSHSPKKLKVVPIAAGRILDMQIAEGRLFLGTSDGLFSFRVDQDPTCHDLPTLVLRAYVEGFATRADRNHVDLAASTIYQVPS